MKKRSGVVVAIAFLSGLLVFGATPAASAFNAVKHSMYCYNGVYHITWKVREPLFSFRDMKIRSELWTADHDRRQSWMRTTNPTTKAATDQP